MHLSIYLYYVLQEAIKPPLTNRSLTFSESHTYLLTASVILHQWQRLLRQERIFLLLLLLLLIFQLSRVLLPLVSLLQLLLALVGVQLRLDLDEGGVLVVQLVHCRVVGLLLHRQKRAASPLHAIFSLLLRHAAAATLQSHRNCGGCRAHRRLLGLLLECYVRLTS